MSRRSGAADTERPLLAGLDSEDDGQGNPFLWSVVSERGAWVGESRHAVLEHLAELGKLAKSEGRKCQVWATNLEYDLVNVFDPERIVECSLRFGRHALCGASWRGVDFRDTMRHIPISVAAFGELLGLKKLEGGLFREGAKRSAAAYRRRCVRDATITYRAAKFFHDLYGELEVRPRMTLASTALNLWQEHFWAGGVYRPEPEVYDAAFSAYHGGRTQAFAVGTFRNVRMVDAASMFPWAMVTAPLPLPWGLYRRVGAGAEIRGSGLYRARVTSDLTFPMLPVRTDTGTQYPNGSWESWYVGEELQAFVRYGGRARVLEGFEFSEMVRPFDAYVARLFELKNNARGLSRTAYKLLLNSLYGKFSQQGSRVHAVPLDKLLAMENPPLEWRPWNGLAIYSTDHEPPPWSNHVWPAFVTARARVRLAETAHRVIARGGRVLYCDTDSLMFEGVVRFPKKARAPGDFELRGTYRQALIVGKKEYALEVKRGRWETHAKGVPAAQREQYLREGVATFVRPVRIRESSRIGQPANVWREVTKQRRTVLRGGPDGRVPTPKIGGGKIIRKKGRATWQRERGIPNPRSRTKTPATSSSGSKRRAGVRTRPGGRRSSRGNRGSS